MLFLGERERARTPPANEEDDDEDDVPMSVRVLQIRVGLCVEGAEKSPSIVSSFIGMVNRRPIFQVQDHTKSLRENITPDLLCKYNLRKRKRKRQGPHKILCEVNYWMTDTQLNSIVVPWKDVYDALVTMPEEDCGKHPFIKLDTRKPLFREFCLDKDVTILNGPFLSERVECSICMEEHVCVVSPRLLPENLDNACFLWPCKSIPHATCYQCCRKMLLNFQNHAMNPQTGGVSCVNNECHLVEQYRLEELYPIMNEEDIRRLEEFTNKFEARGLTSFRHAGCGKLVYVDIQKMKEQGTVLCYCQHCDTQLCYLCQNEQTEQDLDDGSCSICGGEDAPHLLGAHNRYFYRPGKTKYQAMEGLMRNFELNAEEVVIPQLEEIIQQEEPCIRCVGCGTQMHRSESCCELTHCNRKSCWFCGFKASALDTHLYHYSEDSDCYQFITSHPMLKHLYLCSSACHSHCSPCTDETHRTGIRALHDVRKKQMVNKALESLPPMLLRKTLVLLSERNSPILRYIV